MTTCIMTYHGFQIRKTHSDSLKCWHYSKDDEGGIADSFEECIEMIDLLLNNTKNDRWTFGLPVKECYKNSFRKDNRNYKLS